MSGDHLERLAEYVAHLEETVARYGAGADEYVVTLNLNHDEGGTRDALHLADLRAALAELARLRAEQALLARRLQHAYRSGFDDRHYSALAALGLASLNRESLAQQHATKVLAEIAEANAAPQQPERDGGGS